MRESQLIGWFMLTQSTIWAASPASVKALVFQFIWLLMALVVFYLDWRTK
jgi:hypothetical protein